MRSRRRNGQPASCEPCRKDKVRCDHGTPVCGRCQKRDTASCFYHPAPLTRQTLSHSRNRRSARSSTVCHEEIQRQTSSRVEISIRSPDTGPALPSGYFGPTSFVSALGSTPDNGCTISTGAFNGCILPSFWIPETIKALGHLRELSMIEQLVREYYDISQAAVIPIPFIYRILVEMRDMFEEGETSQSLHTKTSQALENTALKFQIPSDTQAKDFHKLVTGPRLRLEVIGTLYAIAGDASLCGFAHGRFQGAAESTSAARIRFARMMITASDTIIQVCRVLTPTNDLTIMMLYQHWVLSCAFHGEHSSATWHRLGVLSNCVHELGLHRDCQKTEGIPIFLREIRRRLFAALYHADKVFATVFGRPPHVSWRYSDSKLPLDISDDALAGEEQELQRAISGLDNEGWDTYGVYQFSSWYRIRYLMSRFREEILELSLQPLGSGAAEKLRDISSRCTETWQSIPAHLRYSSKQWNDNFPIAVRVMLPISCLIYLHNLFLIQRLLTQHDPSAEASLLDVSSQILSAVLMLGKQRDSVGYISLDFTATMVLYGFSSASILIKALQTQVRTGQPMPYIGSRAELIRNLSVLISHIESMARPSTSHVNVRVNFELFQRASTMFTNILDEVLESPIPPHLSAAIDKNELDIRLGIPSIVEGEWDGSWAADGMEFLDTLDFGVVFDQWVF
ncbi:hypothetical protein BJX99DRAFT_228812 [Aspergillus californicus]